MKAYDPTPQGIQNAYELTTQPIKMPTDSMQATQAHRSRAWASAKSPAIERTGVCRACGETRPLSDGDTCDKCLAGFQSVIKPISIPTNSPTQALISYINSPLKPHERIKGQLER